VQPLANNKGRNKKKGGKPMQTQLQSKPMPRVSLPTILVYSTGDDFINPVIPSSHSQWRQNSHYSHRDKPKGQLCQLKTDKPKESVFKQILGRIIRNWEAKVLVLVAVYLVAQIIRVV
jgi:hypothetical protein